MMELNTDRQAKERPLLAPFLPPYACNRIENKTKTHLDEALKVYVVNLLKL